MAVCSAPSPLRLRAQRPTPSVLREIERSVQLILAGTGACQPVFERRRAKRYPFPYPIRLIPVSTEGCVLIDEAMYVLGKHLSPHGVDFYGTRPLPYRFAVMCFDCGEGRRLQLLMDLTWCRFCHHGWYENGGRFLQEIAPTTTADCGGATAV